MDEFLKVTSLVIRSLYDFVRNKDSITVSECIRTLDLETARTQTVLGKYRATLSKEAAKRLDIQQVSDMAKFAYLAYQKPILSKLYITNGVISAGSNQSYQFIRDYHFIDFLDNTSSKDTPLSKGYVVASEKELIVAIKGTSTIDDWLADINAVPLSALFNPEKFNELDALGTFVHPGFLKMSLWVVSRLQAILSSIKDRQEKKRLVFTGHSLGGAVAIVSGWLAANAELLKVPIDVVAFGAPSVDTEQKIVSHANLSEFRIVRPGDAVAGIGLAMFNEWDDLSERFILGSHGEILYFDNSTAARAILLFEFLTVASRMLKDKLAHWPSLQEQKALSTQERKNWAELEKQIKSDLLGFSKILEMIRLSINSNEHEYSVPHPMNLLKVNTSLNQQDFFTQEHPMERYLQDLNSFDGSNPNDQ